MSTAAPPTATCPACHAPLSEGARFCHRCGRALVGSGASSAPWIVAWTLVLVSVGGIVFYLLRDPPAPAAPPQMANAPTEDGGAGQAPRGGTGGAPPDISQMTPEERFIRLHDRVMAAEEQGDTATMRTFAPMAIQAYQMLPQVDSDLRYHAGALQVRAGDYAAALALADTIAQGAPDHLYASLLRAEVAQARGDQAAFTRARKAFLDNYDRELARNRPEYAAHQAMLTELRAQFSR
jgi:hypothetical protein